MFASESLNRGFQATLIRVTFAGESRGKMIHRGYRDSKLYIILASDNPLSGYQNRDIRFRPDNLAKV